MNYLFIWINIVRIIYHNFRILIWYSSWHRIIFITKENKTISNFLINKKSFKASHRNRGKENRKMYVFTVYHSEYIYISTTKRSIKNFDWLQHKIWYTHKWIIHIIQCDNIFQVGFLVTDHSWLKKEIIWQIFFGFLLYKNLGNKSIC